jgi:hypothetical protein
MILFLFIEGTHSVKSIFGFEVCKSGYWVSFVLQYLSLIGLSYLGFKIVSKEYRMKIESGYPFDE